MKSIVRIMMRAFADEKKSYQQREKGAHRGDLGMLSIELLKVLIWFGRKHGRIFPSLAHTLRKCEDTIASALGRLIVQRFVTKHRRSRLIRTPQGERRVQDSNCYEVHMPEDAAGIPGLLPPFASDPKNSGVPVQKADGEEARSNPDGAEDRFWLSDPHQRPDGSWT
jgi:hypothetical protein